MGATQQAALEVARQALGPNEAAFGWRRMSLVRLAAWLAEDALAAEGLAPATQLSIEAVWTRVVHRLHQRGEQGRLANVADRPGLPKALARAVGELRLGGVPVDTLRPELARAAAEFEAELARAGLVDRAQLLAFAARAARAHPPVGDILFYDVAVQAPREVELVQALAPGREAFVTVPTGDVRSLRFLEEALGASAEVLPEPEGGPARLRALREHLFSERSPAPDLGTPEEVVMLSAPGEARECVELARKLHQEAERGVPFDRMAVLLRAPGQYRTAIREALRRAGIPAYFARGARQPDPSGRAFLALLECKEDGLSVRRFAEYLSLGEVPPPDAEGAPPPPDPRAWAPADEPELGEDGEEVDAQDEAPEPPPDDVELERPPPRAPRRWEQILVDAAVIGGRARWERRLAAHAAARRRALEEAKGDEARVERITRELEQLEDLRRFSLPLLAALEELPTEAMWGEWLQRFAQLASRALRRPERVLSLFAQLAPMSEVGPVPLREVKRVLSERLTELTAAPPRRRAGAVFVGAIDDARGLPFDVVFVPGLAERIFPQRLIDDPILSEAERERLAPRVTTRQDDAAAERLQLHLAVGAAKERLVLSYPRLDSDQARPRVPSFYALEVLRAAEGTLPNFTELTRRAEREVLARLGWPAPADPDLALDATERDLSTLDRLFRDPDGPPVGAARYLLEVSPTLARALRRQARLYRRRWSPADGLLEPSAEALAALAAHRLNARAYSPSALQHFAACPYRFLLGAIHRLAPRETPESLEQLDPLQRGTLVHEVQYRVLSELRDGGLLPLSAEKLPQALDRLDAVLDEVATAHREVLYPAIERVWQDAIQGIRADLRQWLRLMQQEMTAWVPWRFELAFGLPPRETADPHSTPEPVELENGIRLRGSIDLVEQSPEGALRATDYKTGKARADASTIVGGGEKLQPVLYALTLEKLFPGAKVAGGRLFYCTQAGGFEAVSIPLDDRARAQAREVARIIGEAIERGWFPAAPVKRGCEYCDFREVCGENVEARTARKPQAELAELTRLRELK